MQPKLTYNCPEKWENMKIGLVARHCDHCNKHVHDFTSMSRQDIYQFFLEHRNEQICGRILPSQIDYSHQERLIIIDALLKKNRNTNMAFFLLAVGSLTLLSCNGINDDGKQLKSDTIIEVNGNHKHSNNCFPHGNHPSGIDTADIPLMGMIGPPDTTATDLHPRDTTQPYFIVEQMPEFKGGVDNLMAYLKKNIKYPDYEKKNKIQGTVYVQFVIDKKGKVTKPKILRTVTNAKNFDEEVLRVVKQMPDWIPGKQDGKNVNVELVLPVAFRLN